MKTFLRTFTACVLAMMCMPAVMRGNGNGQPAADSTALYLWVVDVSGQTNIYMDEVQPAIDSFYVRATARDRLQVMRYAATVISDSTLLDDYFYSYSDQGVMLQAIDEQIGRSDAQVIRAYVLSDFVNTSPAEGSAVLTPESLLTIRQHLLSYSGNGKDIRLTMLILPPSTSPVGYSLDAIRTVVPESMYRQCAVTSADSLLSYLNHDFEADDRLLGRTEETTGDTSSAGLILSLVVLAIMMGAIGFGIWKAYPNQKTKRN